MIFQQVFDWAIPKVTPKTKSNGTSFGRSRPKSVTGSLEFGKPARLGSYDIQPIRAKGRKALDELNQWLIGNQFPVQDPKRMAYFIKKGFTFLCIKVIAAKGNNGVGNGIDPAPPGNPPVNDGPGAGPGNPGNKKGKGSGSRGSNQGKGKKGS